MILTLNISKENPLLQIFTSIDQMISTTKDLKQKTGGRPRLYSDIQIVKCLVYQAFNRIIGFRELEWHLAHDPIAKTLIGLEKVPDHTTFCIRAQSLEDSLYEEFYQLAVTQLKPQTRICYWDSTALRASRCTSWKGHTVRLVHRI